MAGCDGPGTTEPSAADPPRRAGGAAARAGAGRGPLRRGQPGGVLHRRLELPAGADRRGRARAPWRRRPRRSRCARAGAPLLSRGGGTSLAGQCTNAAVVIDWSKYCHRLVSVDADGADLRGRARHRAGRAEPAAGRHGLQFGPKPATHSHCTLGGMIGNNSCGATAQRTARSSTTSAGWRCSPTTAPGCGSGRDPDERVRADRRRRAAAAPRSTAACATCATSTWREIRHALPRHPAPGVGLQPGLAAARERLRPGRAAGRQRGHAGHRAAGRAGAGAGAARPGAGRARLPGHRRRRRRRCPQLLPHSRPAAGGAGRPADPARARGARLTWTPCDAAAGRRRLADGAVRRRHPGGGRRAGARAAARPWAAAEHDADVALLRRPGARAGAAGQVREAGLGATARAAGRRARPGRAGRTPRSRRSGSATTCATCASSSTSSATAHAPRCTATSGRAACTPASRSTLTTADGVAALPPLPGAGRRPGRLLRRVAVRRARRRPGPRRAAAQDVRRRARAAFGQVKAIFDPDNRMNPGKVVAPNPLDEHLRLGADWQPRRRRRPHFGYPGRRGHASAGPCMRCVGVGKCRQPRAAA